MVTSINFLEIYWNFWVFEIWRFCCCLGVSDENLRFLACQSVWIKDFLVSTWDESGVTFNTSDETMRIAWNWETWEWPEFGGWWAGWHFAWTFESNDGWKTENFNCHWLKTCKKYFLFYLLGCKIRAIDQASCNRGYGHRTLDQVHMGVDGVHRRHISSSWLNIVDCLGRFQIGIHSQELRLGLLGKIISLE